MCDKSNQPTNDQKSKTNETKIEYRHTPPRFKHIKESIHLTLKGGTQWT